MPLSFHKRSEQHRTSRGLIISMPWSLERLMSSWYVYDSFRSELIESITLEACRIVVILCETEGRSQTETAANIQGIQNHQTR